MFHRELPSSPARLPLCCVLTITAISLSVNHAFISQANKPEPENLFHKLNIISFPFPNTFKCYSQNPSIHPFACALTFHYLNSLIWNCNLIWNVILSMAVSTRLFSKTNFSYKASIVLFSVILTDESLYCTGHLLTLSTQNGFLTLRQARHQI